MITRACGSSPDDARITGSRRAADGCDARTWDAWKAQIGAFSAKKLAAVRPEPGKELGHALVGMMIGTPNGYLAALSLYECAALTQQPDFLTRWIGNSIARWPGFRGPRTATQTLILTAGLQLDRVGAEVEYPGLERTWISGDGTVGAFAAGGIKSVAVEGDRATITFAKQKVKQTRCVKGHTTNRISQIMSDGYVVYYYECDKEVTEVVEVAPSPPVRVRARYATGLAPGMNVRVAEDAVLVAYPAKSDVPALVTGVEVK